MHKETTMQQSLADYCRDLGPAPEALASRPENLPWYRRLVHNNIIGVIEQAFPLAAQFWGEEPLLEAIDAFIAQGPLHDPQLWKLPLHFADYIRDNPKEEYPAWLADLLLFEWTEIEVHTQADQEVAFDPEGDLLTAPLVLNPHTTLLELAWPVHKMGKVEELESGFYPLLFFRHPQRQTVEFMELSPLHARLGEALAYRPTALPQFAEAWQEQLGLPAELIAERLGEFVQHLHQQGAIYGTC